MNKKNAELIEHVKDNEKLQSELRNLEVERKALALNKDAETNIEKIRKDVEQTLASKLKENSRLQQEIVAQKESHFKKLNEYKNRINELEAEVEGSKIDKKNLEDLIKTLEKNFDTEFISEISQKHDKLVKEYNDMQEDISQKIEGAVGD